MATEIVVPTLGESLVEATVGKWFKKAGEAVKAGEPVVELETDKINMEVPAPTSGVLSSVAKGEGETVGIGEVLALVDEAGQAEAAATAPAKAEQKDEVAPAAAAPAAQTAPAPAEAAVADIAGRSTPTVRRLAAENTIDLSRIAGSGPGGRILRSDVQAAMQGQGEAASVPAPAAAAPLQVVFPGAENRRDERVRLSRRRQTIAKQLVEAQHTAAMLTTFNEVDMSAIMDIRSKRKDAFKEEHGVSLGFMSFFVSAVIGALKAYPHINAEIDGDEMILKHYYDIGIAVSTDEGLVVPVLRDADRMNFAEIEQGIAALAKKARGRALTLEDIRGGTFTITNGGVFGSLFSTPILNAPQVGILGMHGIQQRPIAVDGEIAIRPMMYIALSYDHRIVDGSESVRFLVAIKKMLEDPLKLMLEG